MYQPAKAHSMYEIFFKPDFDSPKPAKCNRMSFCNIAKIRIRNCTPSLAPLIVLAAYFGISLDYLVGHSDDSARNEVLLYLFLNT